MNLFLKNAVVSAIALTSVGASAMSPKAFEYKATCAVFLNHNVGGTHDNVANVDVDLTTNQMTEIYSNGTLAFKIGLPGDVPGQGQNRVILSIRDVSTNELIAKSEVSFKATPSISEIAVLSGLKGGVMAACYPR